MENKNYYNKVFVGNRIGIHINFDRDINGNIIFSDGYYRFSINITDKPSRSLVTINNFRLDEKLNLIIPGIAIHMDGDFISQIERQASIMAEMNFPVWME